MPTARERMLELSSLPTGNLARDHFLSISVTSVILIPEQGEIIETQIDEEILDLEVPANQIDEEILDVDFKLEEDSFIIEVTEDANSIQECC